MVIEKNGSAGLEWKVTVPGGSSVKLEPETGLIGRAWAGLLGLVMTMKSKVFGFITEAWKLGVDDPRKVFHGLKMGLALTLVSFFYYLRPLYNGVGGNAMWAVMTVVVVLEFTVGGTLYKGFNRVCATFLAGSLGFGVHWVASKCGEKAEPVILSSALFFLASAASFSRFIPRVKARFDYGVTIFILTFSLVSVSGYRVDKLMDMAEQRLSTIGIGCSICLLVGLLLRPVWAGQDLHNLITRNMDKLADSLEECVLEYFEDGGTGDGKPSQKSQGYKCVLNSKASEDSLANFARWEPAHGHFSFRHPWKHYLKVAASMRHCAYCLETLHGSISSDAGQAPEFVKKHLRNPCIELSTQSFKVLKELVSSIKSMTKSSSIDFLVGEMNSAVEELQTTLRGLQDLILTTNPPLILQNKEEAKQQNISAIDAVPLMELLPILTVASMLIDITTRIERVVDEVDTLATLACFRSASDEKPQKATEANMQPNPGPMEQEAMKALQMV